MVLDEFIYQLVLQRKFCPRKTSKTSVIAHEKVCLKEIEETNFLDSNDFLKTPLPFS